MDPGQGDAAGHVNATPNKGFDTHQVDGELVDCGPWRHAGQYAGPLSAGQADYTRLAMGEEMD